MKYVNPFANRKEEIFTLILLLAFMLSMVGVDWNNLGDWFQLGRMRYLLFSTSVLVFFWLYKANPWAAGFASWSFFSWALFDFQEHGVLDVLMIGSAIAIGMEIHKRVSPMAICKLIAYASLAQASYAFVQSFGFEPFLNLSNIDKAFIGEPIGTIGNPTMLGAFCVLGALYWLTNGSRWKALVCCSMVFYTGSTMSVLALFMGGLYWLFRYRPKTAVGISLASAIPLFLCSIYFPTVEFFSYTGRLGIWKKALTAWWDNPILGHGPGSWAGYLGIWGGDFAHMGLNWNQVHNDWLQVLMEQGLVGSIVLLLGYGALLIRAHKLPVHYGAWIVALGVNCLGNFLMHSVTFGVIAGWLLVEVWNQENKENSWKSKLFE